MRILNLIMIVLLLFISFSNSYAQSCDDTTPLGPGICCVGGVPITCDAGPPPVPITGIELLLGAGALLGARRFMAGRKKKESE
jgi:hypothetical protein